MKRIGVVMAVVLCLTVACTADVLNYQAILNGSSESPPNASAGTGFAIINYDNVAHTLYISVQFSGLTGNTTASHIHCCTANPFTGTAGVATTTPTFAGFPLGVTSGTYTNTLDLTLASSWNPAFVSAQGGISQAEALLAAHLGDGKEYLNIHTNVVPGGEIRGFITPVPEPATMTLIAGGIAGLLGKLRKRKA